MDSMCFSMIKNFARNLLFSIPLIREYKEKHQREILELRMALIMHCYPDLQKEADYLLKNGASMVPYPIIKATNNIVVGFDEDYKLPFVIHKGKKMFYPKNFSPNDVKTFYLNLIEVDCILGGVHREKQPHQYQTDSFKIEEGDVLADVGCAEALLALDTIDLVSRAYLFEGDPKWIPALKATFCEYEDKVVIINKYVSDIDSDTTVTLQSALKCEEGKNIFIKMDIEGAEIEVLKGSKSFLKSTSNIKIACCTYHHQDDADLIHNLFKEIGLENEFSEGYMYLKGYDRDFRFPYFRRGVLRGWK